MESTVQAQNTEDILEKTIRKQKYELFVSTLALVIEKYGKDILEGTDNAA